MKTLKEAFVDTLNSLGLYTSKQYIEMVEQKSEMSNYARHLEKAIAGMNDPTKPILIYGNGIELHNVVLQPFQQIIVSPSAYNISISTVFVSPKDKQISI